MGFVFSHFTPFVPPPFKSCTQQLGKAEIARKKRELILAISVSQVQNAKKPELSCNMVLTEKLHSFMRINLLIYPSQFVFLVRLDYQILIHHVYSL